MTGGRIEDNLVDLVTAELTEVASLDTGDRGVWEVDSYGSQGDYECRCRTRRVLLFAYRGQDNHNSLWTNQAKGSVAPAANRGVSEQMPDPRNERE